MDRSLWRELTTGKQIRRIKLFNGCDLCDPCLFYLINVVSLYFGITLFILVLILQLGCSVINYIYFKPRTYLLTQETCMASLTGSVK